MKPFKRFMIMALFAMLSAISFIQCFQYISEKTGKGLWIGLGVLFAGLTFWQLYIINKEAGSSKDQ
jgi:hypothetical protein